MKLLLKNANGTEQRVDLGPEGLKLAARPGVTYRVIDEQTSKTPPATVVKRVRDDLLIQPGGADAPPVEITGFFSECTPSDRCWTVLDVPAATAPAEGEVLGAIGDTGSVVITQDGNLLGALAAGGQGGLADGQWLAFGTLGHWGTTAAVGAGTAAFATGIFDHVGTTAASATAGGGNPNSGNGHSGGDNDRRPTDGDGNGGGNGGMGGGNGGNGSGGNGGNGGNGNGGGTETPTENDPDPGPFTIHGVVAAGPMQAGTVDVYAYDKDGHLLGHSLVSDNSGRYEIRIEGRAGYTGPVLLVARDADGAVADNYLDENTGVLVNLGLSLAAVGASPGTSNVLEINITPLTQLAALEMGIDVNADNASFVPPANVEWIAMMNHAVSVFFGLKDILGELVTINDPAFAGASVDAAAYGVALARLSELDAAHGGLAATLAWLSDLLVVDGTTMRSFDSALTSLDTVRTVSTLADRAAADAMSAEMADPVVNLANLAQARIVLALPVNAVVGDLIHLRLTGPDGTVQAGVFAITAEDLARGYALLGLSAEALQAVGAGLVFPSAIVTDAEGHNASAAIFARAFLADAQVPTPTLTVDPASLAEDASQVETTVTWPDMVAGEEVQLMLGGEPLGDPVTVTPADVLAGHVRIRFSRLLVVGNDEPLWVTVTDTAGNTGSTSGLEIVLEENLTPPAPTLVIKPGQDSVLGAAEATIDLQVTYTGLAAGDVVQLQLGGHPLGSPHTVTDTEAASGSVTLTVDKALLGTDGVKAITVVATDAAGNAGTSPVLPLTLDSITLTPTLSLAPGQDGLLGSGDSSVTLQVSYGAMQAGDVVQLRIAGQPFGAAHTVTSTEAAAGMVGFVVDKAALGADGIKAITVTTTDAAGNSATSIALPVTLDTTPPAPTLSLHAGDDAVLGLSDSAVRLDVSFSGMQAGDVIQLKLAGAPFGTPHTVTSAEATAGLVTLTADKAGLGTDGVKAITVTATDAAGNAGTSAALAITLDTVAPAPVLGFAPGQDGVLNGADTGLDLQLGYAGMQAGDVVQLKLGGADLGTAYTVQAADVQAGTLTLHVAAADLGSDGLKSLGVSVTDLAGNAGSGTPLSVTLDTIAPSAVFSSGTGALLVSAGSALLGGAHSGVALVDASTAINDGAAVSVAQVTMSLSGFLDGSAETLALNGVTLAADGSGAPASVTIAGQAWAVVFHAGSYTFTATGGSAGAAQVAALMQVSYNDLAGTITDGQRIIGFTLTDTAGNVGPTASASVLVATAPPAITATIDALSDDTGIAGDLCTTVASQTITGSYSGVVDVGDRIQVSTDGVHWTDATFTSASTWSASGITLLLGQHDLYLRVTDTAGNASTPTTRAYELDNAVIATTATILGATDNVTDQGSSSGALSSGQSTDDDTPLLNGSISAPLASGQAVALYDTHGGVTVRVGEATVSGTTWTFQSGALSDGDHDFKAVVEDPSSGATGSLSTGFNIDPQSISLGLLDNAGSVQGWISDDGSTDDRRPTLSGSLGSTVLGVGEVVAIYNGNTRIGVATVTGNQWSFEPSLDLVDGLHSFRAIIQDDATGTASNGRVVSTTLDITVDSSGLVPVQTLTIDSVTDDVGTHSSTTGTLAAGQSTDDFTPTLAGTLSAPLLAGQAVRVYDMASGTAVLLGSASVSGTGWSFTTGQLTQGDHQLVAVVESVASGAQGTPSAAFDLITQSIDLTHVTDDVGSSIGSIGNHGLTDDSLPTISGTLASASLGSGEVLAIYDGNLRLGNATINGTHWTFTPSTPLADGSHTFRAMIQDDMTGTASNGRVVSDTITVTVVTTVAPPAQAVTITDVLDDTVAGLPPVSVPRGSSCDDPTPTLGGTVNASMHVGDVIAVYDGSTRLGEATISGGTWSFTAPPLGLGSHTLTARVENTVTGLHGTASAGFTLITQSLTASALTDDVGSQRGPIANGGVTDDDQPTFTGTLGTASLGAGEVVAIYDGSTKLGEATVTGQAWSFTPSTPLADGAHAFQAILQDSATGTAGVGGAASAVTTFVVNTSTLPPSQTTTITGASEATTTHGSVSGAFASGTSTDGTTPSLSGSLSAPLLSGQGLAIYDGSTRLGYATVSGTGWTYTTPTLAIGSHALTAVVENQATGLQGVPSASFTVIEQSITVDNLLGLTGAVQVLIGGIASVVLGVAPQFTGTLGTALGANEVIAVYDGSTKIGNATVNGTVWGFTPTSPLATGFHHISVMVQDASIVNVNQGRVVASATDFTVDVSLLVPAQLLSIDWAIESSARNGSVTGSFGSGASIDSSTPSIGGSISAPLTGAQVVAVYDGTTRLGTATVSGQSWSFTTPALVAGLHNLSVQVENPVTGSTGPNSGAFVVNMQTLSSLTLTDDVGTLRGSVATGGVTDDANPTISGTLGSSLGLLEAVAIYDTVNGVSVKLGVALVIGQNWSFTPLLPLADGNHSFTAVVQNVLDLTPASGRVVSDPLAVTIDTSVPPLQLVAIVSATDDTSTGGSKTGALLLGGVTDDALPSLSGTLTGALGGAQKLAVYDTVNGVKTRIGYATIDSGNLLHWTFTPDAPLAAGTHSLTARVENTATGAQGLESLAFGLVERPVTLKVTDNVGAMQGDVLGFGNATTDDTSLALSGTIGSSLGAFEWVKVYDNGTYIGTATVNGTDWSLAMNGLSLGSHHSLSVRIEGLAGVYTVATGGSFTVASADLPATTTDPSYSSLASLAKFTVSGNANLLDLTQVSGSAQGHIDVIDLGSAANSVKLSLTDVLQSGSTNAFSTDSGWIGVNGTGKHQILVDGASGTVTMTDGSWSTVGTVSHDGHTYTVYEDSTHLAQLLVESHLTKVGPLGV